MTKSDAHSSAAQDAPPTISRRGELSGRDARLVDYVSAVLVDPNLHTDLRMRLHEEIVELLHSTHPASPRPDPDASSPSPRRPGHDRAEATTVPWPAPDHPVAILEAVLVDPNLHTDTRMRLHDQISVLLRHATERSPTAH
ncbi:MAG TPA: hypothetical protein VII87_12575 [Solirubrobacteraceae bacterium]|jgi:hypothetical protein